MTVKELIKLLEKFDGDSQVVIETLDKDGYTVSKKEICVFEDEDDNTVIR